jgi:hypothetical protein
MTEPPFEECANCACTSKFTFRCSVFVDPVQMKLNHAINGLCRAVKPRKELRHVK